MDGPMGSSASPSTLQRDERRVPTCDRRSSRAQAHQPTHPCATVVKFINLKVFSRVLRGFGHTHYNENLLS